MSAAVTTYATIDDHLGPAEGRYFGGGFRRVSHRITGAVLEHAAGRITARAGVTYPDDWSTKSAGRSLTPHLSTIDATIVSIALAESYLTHTFTLDEEQRRDLWLRRLVITASSRPQEQLGDFGIIAWHTGTTTDHDTATSVFDCRIGNLRTRCDVAHPVLPPRRDHEPALLPDDLLGAPSNRYYGRGFQTRQHQLCDVRIAADRAEASADVHISDTTTFPDGFGGRHQPSATVIDGTVVLAQLTQSLLYHLDDIDRAQSNTLWMRRIDVTANSPEPPLAGRFRSSAAIVRSALVDFDGGTWRTSDCAMQFSGMRFELRVAHQLPATTRAGAR